MGKKDVEKNMVIKTLIPRKKYRKRPDTRARELAFLSLITSGIKPSKASEMLGFSPGTGSRIAARLREQGNEIPTLMSASRDEKLLKMIDNFLDQGAKMRKIRGSDAIGVAKLYADRRYPVKQEAGGDSFSFVKVDISVYKNDHFPLKPTEDKDI